MNENENNPFFLSTKMELHGCQYSILYKNRLILLFQRKQSKDIGSTLEKDIFIGAGKIVNNESTYFNNRMSKSQTKDVHVEDNVHQGRSK